MEDFKEYLNHSVVEARKMKRGRYMIPTDVTPEIENMF